MYFLRNKVEKVLELGQQEENEQKNNVGDASLSLDVRDDTHSNSFSELKKKNITHDLPCTPLPALSLGGCFSTF